MKAVVIDEHGDSDVMHYRNINMPTLKPGQVRIAMRACSLNYHDILTRRGMPAVRTPLPMILGCDCAGVIAEMAPDVRGWSCGDRVLADPLARVVRHPGRSVTHRHQGQRAIQPRTIPA
jgi:alcohol dehydrogenase